MRRKPQKFSVLFLFQNLCGRLDCVLNIFMHKLNRRTYSRDYSDKNSTGSPIPKTKQIQMNNIGFQNLSNIRIRGNLHAKDSLNKEYKQKSDSYFKLPFAENEW